MSNSVKKWSTMKFFFEHNSRYLFKSAGTYFKTSFSLGWSLLALSSKSLISSSDCMPYTSFGVTGSEPGSTKKAFGKF